MTTYLKFAVLALTVALAGGGCRSLGPKEITGTHHLYNQAIVDSLDGQLLQNLVRLRYRDNPYFLEIGSVTSSMSLEASAGTDSELSGDSGGDLWMPHIGAVYSTGPTISYVPLQGEDFLNNILTPISLESLFVLIQSGWSAERVFGLCVERINGMQNAPTASGPTPSSPPRDQDRFLQLLRLLESIRDKGLLYSKIDQETGELFIHLGRYQERDAHPEVAQILQLLDLDPEVETYSVDGEFFHKDRVSISIRTRSIMSMLFYLSQNVEIPSAHEEQGLVTVTRHPGGSRYDWSNSAAGAKFRVYSTDKRPESASLAIPYRGQWFYLDENDLDSKSSFMLLSQLFNLQAGNVQRGGPALTIPVSR